MDIIFVLCSLYLIFIFFYYGRKFSNSNVKDDQRVSSTVLMIFFSLGAIAFIIDFSIKFFKPHKINNEKVVHWFVNDICSYCDKTYGVNPKSVFHN